MRIKTQATLITEDTYPIAVACLPAGFAAYPFANVKGYWLVINVPGTYDHNHFEGDNSPALVTVHNLWIHPKEFMDKYEIINKKPGRQPENAWVECELAVDKDLKEFLETSAESEFEQNTIVRSNPMSVRTRRNRRFVAGYHRG